MTWDRVQGLISLTVTAHKANSKTLAGACCRLAAPKFGRILGASGVLGEPSDSLPLDGRRTQEVNSATALPAHPTPLWQAGPTSRPRIEQTRRCAERAEDHRRGAHASPPAFYPRAVVRSPWERTSSVDPVCFTHRRSRPLRVLFSAVLDYAPGPRFRSRGTQRGGGFGPIRAARPRIERFGGGGVLFHKRGKKTKAGNGNPNPPKSRIPLEFLFNVPVLPLRSDVPNCAPVGDQTPDRGTRRR